MTSDKSDCPCPSFATAPEWLRPRAAAALAGGVSPRTIRRWVVAGFFDATRPAGGTVLIDRDSLRAFLDAGRVRPVAR